MSKKIYIGKLPDKITDKQLSDIFSKIGRVISLKIIKVISFQDNMNYGYVQMDTDDNSNKAIKTLNNSLLEGSRIKVMEAHFLDKEKQEHPYWKKRRF
ncbi:MAG: hypothetical protein HYW86_01685 [Candidatus Roizmanbacteria bacterium]|nr:MAG: hypothetical protein HYW86_01685 [Candidatus Roizmanbacteria bacterium]